MRRAARLKHFDRPAGGLDVLVNYVWLNAEPDVPDRVAESSVPLRYLDEAYANARRYPAVRFKIWFDESMLDARTRRCVGDHRQRRAPANIAFSDLNQIPAFRAEPIFADAARTDIWARVDYARLLVLDHALASEPETYVVYADFDIPRLHLRAARKKMEAHGVVLVTGGAIRHWPPCLNRRRADLQNSYLGFQKAQDGPEKLAALLRVTRVAALAGQNGFAALSTQLETWAAAAGIAKDAFILPHLAYTMGYVIPDNPRYRRANWNA